ncbi:MAG: hypothetical protein AAF085_12760 [Planctomycetota bacterium]
MRRPSFTHLFLCTSLFASTVLVGCESTRKAGNDPLLSPPAQPEPRSARTDAPTAAQMQELLGRLQTLEIDNAQLKKRLSDQYMEAVALRAAQIEAEKRGRASQPTTQPAAPEVQANQGQAVESAKSTDLSKLSRVDLLDALLKQIANSKDPDRVKALMAAALSVASDHKQMDPRLLDALDPKSREQVARFHQMLAVAFDELASDKRATLTRREMIRKIDEVFGAQPLQIEQFQLCRRVDSYGVFEPFATTRFLAGQKNRVLVYVELENFMHEPLEDGRYEVRLEQSVELYDATGETTVWRQGPVQLVDVSRNKRRDFFIVYPIDLPARLPAGGYRLKVRIADKHTGSICEQTMHDIKIVADQGLVNGR